MPLRLNKREPLNIITFTEYLFVLILILNARTIWTSFEDSPLNRALKVAVVAVGMFYIVLLPMRAIRNILLSLVLGLIYIVAYITMGGYEPRGFIFFVFTVIAIYAFLQTANGFGRGTELLYKYRDIILIVAAVSLVFWVLGSTLGIISPTGVAYTTWGAHNIASGVKAVPSYYGVYFETQNLEDAFGALGYLTRNTAIFTEAPMCNFNFCMALLIELFFNPKPSKAKSVILVAAVLSTLSTTGYCMLAIALTAKYITSSGGTSLRSLVILSIPLVLIAAAIAFQFLLEDKMSTGSGIDRLRDFVIGLEAWSQRPLFGYGYGAQTYYMGFHYGFSNSITPILGHGGLFLAAPYVYCIVQWCRTCIKEKDFLKFLFFINFIFIFTITIMSYQFLTIFVFFAYCIKREKVVKANT